jgi:hypothetical protein
MIGMYAIIGVAVLAAGIAIGIFTMVSIGTRREERIFREERIISLRDVNSPGRAESAARAFYGHYARTPQVDHGGAHQHDNLRVLPGGGPPS